MSKAFAWSHSRLRAFETCPARHKAIDIDKLFADEGEAAAAGKATHTALEFACRDKVPLPPEEKRYQGVVDKVNALPGFKFYEQKLAINACFSPVTYFAPDVWLRVVVDLLVLDRYADPTRGAAVDYKTGKPKADYDQLELNAAVLLATYPTMQTVELAYWWIAYGGGTMKKKVAREDLSAIWTKFMPRVRAYEKARADGVFYPKPSGLCKKHCPVDTCQYYGVGAGRHR